MSFGRFIKWFIVVVIICSVVIGGIVYFKIYSLKSNDSQIENDTPISSEEQGQEEKDEISVEEKDEVIEEIPVEEKDNEKDNEKEKTEMGDLTITESEEKQVDEENIDDSEKTVRALGDIVVVPTVGEGAEEDNGGLVQKTISLDYMSLLRDSIPKEKLDSVLEEISKPIMKEYGATSHIYEMYNYETNANTIEFYVKCEDDSSYKIVIKEDKGNYTVTVTK